jgi:hypothetical protein
MVQQNGAFKSERTLEFQKRRGFAVLMAANPPGNLFSGLLVGG